MKSRHLFKAFLAAMVCLAPVSSFVSGQQPFEALPGNDNAIPRQDDPIIIRPEQDRAPTRPFQTPLDQEEIPDQVVLLNTKFAGWQEAGIGINQDRLSDSLRANWMMVDANGRFEGVVKALEGAEVTDMIVYLMNMGRLVKQTTVKEDGSFEFNNVSQGAYAVVGWGPKGFFAFGCNLLAYNENQNDNMPTTMTITAYQNETTINTDWIRYFAPRINYRVYGRYPVGEGQNDPASLYGFDGQYRYQPKAAPATSISSHQVNRTADGRLMGRIHQLNSLHGRPVDVRTTKVMLFQGDDVYASTNTDNYGVFEFRDVPNGEYGLVATGSDGMGMIGITVGDFSAMTDEGELVSREGDLIDLCMVSSETIGWLNNYATEVAYRRAILSPRKGTNNLCNDCCGQGCQNCYGTGLCRSRAQAYREWIIRCRNQHEITKLGSGFIMSGIAADMREAVRKQDERYERAFYGAGINQ